MRVSGDEPAPDVVAVLEGTPVPASRGEALTRCPPLITTTWAGMFGMGIWVGHAAITGSPTSSFALVDRNCAWPWGGLAVRKAAERVGERPVDPADDRFVARVRVKTEGAEPDHGGETDNR
jgi:hypothetical protein